MSMLSVQAEELRELARRINELQGGAVRAVTMPSNVGVTLRDAADTILSLRDRAQELQAENAKLRAVIESEIHCWKGSCNGCVAYRPTEDGWCDQQTWLEELGIEGQL